MQCLDKAHFAKHLTNIMTACTLVARVHASVAWIAHKPEEDALCAPTSTPKESRGRKGEEEEEEIRRGVGKTVHKKYM